MKSEIRDLIKKLSNYRKFNLGKYLLHSTVKTMCKRYVTESIRLNAEYQSKFGLQPKIIRSSSGHCCPWCDEVTGSFKYPNVPKDVYRRHRGCTCHVEFFPGDGKVQNVHSKKWYEEESSEARKNYENLMQHKKGDKVFITDQAINKVKPVGPSSYSEEQLKKIQEMNKQILKVAREKNASNEVAMLFDGENISKPVLGNQYGVDIFADPDMYHAIKGKDTKLRSLVLSHNHPGLSYFSIEDLGIFVESPSIETMEVVTNQGKVFYLTKTKNYDDIEVMRIYKESLKKNSGDFKKAIDNFINNTYNMIELNR